MSEEAYPVSLGIDDSITFTIAAAGTLEGKIIGIRVHDNARAMWFNWDNGVWDTIPSCAPGAGNLYVAFYAIDIGAIAGNLHLELRNAAGQILASVDAYADPYAAQGVGLEWTGNMPTSNLVLTCTVTP